MSKLLYSNIESLNPIKNILNDASQALKDNTRTIDTSSIPDVLGAVAGMGTGAGISFAALYFGGSVVGLSAAGITSGLATAGAVVGGGMVAGMAVLAAPVAVLGVCGYGILAARKAAKLKEEKESLLQKATRTRDAIIRQLKEEINITKARADYLNGLNVLLQGAIRDLQQDLRA